MATWNAYEKANAEVEGGYLDPLTIKGKEFLFPKVVPAKFGMEFTSLIQKYEGRIPDTQAIGLLPLLLPEGQLDELIAATSFPELVAIWDDLLVAYGFTLEEGEDPNPGADQTSAEPSSPSLVR